MVKEKVKNEELDGITCDRCNSSHIVRHGFVITISYGRRQRFKCQDCAHTFYDDEVLGDKQK